MQNVDSFSASCYVDDTVGAACLGNPNLFYALADSRHRLEIVGLVSSLDFIELIARIMPGVGGKVSQTFNRQGSTRAAQFALYPIGYSVASNGLGDLCCDAQFGKAKIQQLDASFGAVFLRAPDRDG